MKLRRHAFALVSFAAVGLCGWLTLGARLCRAQTYDFGCAPLGATNKVNGFNFSGGVFNGTNLYMATEMFIGTNAADFATSPNYTGQSLSSGSNYFFSLSFVPHTIGFATAAFTNYATPSPPFGGSIVYLQGLGAPVARPGSGPVVPELAPLEQAMTNYLVTHQFEAGTLALMKDSRLVLRQGYGWRDTNFSAVIHPDQVFRLASVSKMLTGSAINQLIAAGKISASTKVYAYLGLPPWGGVLGDNRITNITVQQLLDHTGGWDSTVSPVGDPVFRTLQISTEMGLSYPAAPTNVISWMFAKPLDFAPGASNAYSNFGYQILGRIIEKASGKTYFKYLQQDLLANSGLTNALGFTNVVASHTRAADRDPWEIWYTDQPQFLSRSAVDYPTNVFARSTDGVEYYEAFDSFGGVSASAPGLCHYLLGYLESNVARPPGATFSWGYLFYGSLPGATSVLSQNLTQNSTATNGLEFAALFNERRTANTTDNVDAYNAIIAATTNITAWPTNGGGIIQWAVSTTNVNKAAGSLTVALQRTSGSTLPVKISYTTYPLSATSAHFTSNAGVINFPAGVTNQNVTIAILNDHVIDPPLKFTLELISAAGGASLGNRCTCVVNVLDTNTPPNFLGQPVRLPNGNVQCQISSSVGLLQHLEISTNLQQWIAQPTFTNATTVTMLTDTNTAGRAQTFYRMVVP
ncbi:MAG: hypothetical protein RLZZ350_2164 [Verrucomicrobiota bacterium]|jgi:CubicO group peptidase (beta-lactamase class C family)